MCVVMWTQASYFLVKDLLNHFFFVCVCVCVVWLIQTLIVSHRSVSKPAKVSPVESGVWVLRWVQGSWEQWNKRTPTVKQALDSSGFDTLISVSQNAPPQKGVHLQTNTPHHWPHVSDLSIERCEFVYLQTDRLHLCF